MIGCVTKFEPAGTGGEILLTAAGRTPKLGIPTALFLLASGTAGVVAGSPALPPGKLPVVTHHARSLQPGEVVELLVESPVPLRRVEGKVFGRTFPFFPESESTAWRGLVGIDLEVQPGRHDVSLNAVDAEGAPVRVKHMLAVKGKTFPTRRLTVDEKFVNPPPEVQDRIREESRKVQTIFSSATPRRIWRGAFEAPVAARATSSFGKRSILNGQLRSPHSGTDFDAEAGAAVRAPNAGTVVLAEDLYYSGNTVILDHGMGLYSYFAHLSRIDVGTGAEVRRGDPVGAVGATGRVTGPHLHWSVRLAGARVDPLSLIAVLK